MAGSVGQYTQGWFPWMGHKSAVNFSVRTNNSTYLGMGYVDVGPAQNSEQVWDTWLDTGTWKVAQIYSSGTDRAIASWLFNGVSVATIDMYASPSVLNIYAEVTGISVSTAAVTTVTVRGATKNASSGNYWLELSSLALIRTYGIASIPGGTDTPGYTWQYIPGMGNKANTNWSGWNQYSGYLAGGHTQTSNGNQNNAISWDVWVDTGTFKICRCGRNGLSYGIHNFQFDGVTVGTIDNYAAATDLTAYGEATGISVVAAGTKVFQDIMATKNASSDAYYGNLQALAIIRTGA